MLRAFIAVQLSGALKRQIGSVQAELKREVSGSGRGSKAVKIGWAQPEAIHLTLARIRDRVEAGALEPVLTVQQNRVVGGFTASSVELIKSELRPSGAVYTTLVEVPFGAGV